MRKIFYLILIAATFTTCKKVDNNNSNNNNNNHNNNTKSGVIIKGKLGTGKGSESLADAKKVLVFDGVNNMGLNMRFVDIVNGQFIDTLQMGSVTAMVFLDANNKYIGTFCNQGLNLLPLCMLSKGDSTIIDLSTLTMVGTNVIPSHDPFGKEIIISDAELNSLKVIGKFFESLAKNIDADNDGNLDVLNDKQIYITSQFIILGGKYGLNSQAPVIADTAANTIGYNTYINGGHGFVCPSTASMSGPEGDPYPEIFMGHLQQLDNQGGFSTGWGVGDQPFKAGIYTLTLDGKPYTLSFSNIGAKFNLVFAAPTLITNSDGKMKSISMSYLHSDYTPVDPENILTDVMIQLNDSTRTRIFDSPWLKSKHSTHVGNDVVGLYNYNLDTPIDISKLYYIDIVYYDLLSNLYFIQWRR
jgi:hypothetical protein